jgi:hypothetical protein
MAFRKLLPLKMAQPAENKAKLNTYNVIFYLTTASNEARVFSM